MKEKDYPWNHTAKAPEDIGRPKPVYAAPSLGRRLKGRLRREEKQAARLPIKMYEAVYAGPEYFERFGPPPQTVQLVCPACGAVVSEGDAACAACGCPLKADEENA
ncbi:MAG: hypothetical protein IJL52_10290 [Clostridia bacterium]|nr:hypothetical protein [Clostridia bacterium]